MKPARIFHGLVDFRELKALPNTLIGKGAPIANHSHEFDHLAIIIGGPDVRVRARLLSTSGKHSESILEAGDFVYIGRRVLHDFELIAGEEAYEVCIFAKYGRDGQINAPESSAEPYAEIEGKIQAWRRADHWPT